MDKLGFKPNESTKEYSKTPKVGKSIERKRKKRANTLENDKLDNESLIKLDEMHGVTKRIKRKKPKKKPKKENEFNIIITPPVQKPILSKSSSSISTKFPFICNSTNISPTFNENNLSKIPINNNINYNKNKPLLTKKRSRRNATPILSIPTLIGKENFNQLINEIDTINDPDQGNRNDFFINLSKKALTPLSSNDLDR